jgi:hypothetical protein
MTRYNNGIYDKEDLNGKTPSQWMKERFELFEATRESVLSQDGDFEWVISFDERTPKSYIDKVQTDERIVITYVDCREYFDIEPVTDAEWVITSRIDNDDLYIPGFVKAIQDNFSPQVMVIDIDYYQLDLRDGQKYTSARTTATSPFISLIEPASRVKTVYCRPHNKLRDGYPVEDGKKAIPAVKLRDILAYMVIHDDNMANKIVGEKI